MENNLGTTTTNYDWDIGKVKTTKLINGNQVIVEASPKEILQDPNRHRIESIIKALCVTVSQLMRMQEYNDLKKIKNDWNGKTDERVD